MKTATKLTKFILQFLFFCSTSYTWGVVYKILYYNFFFYFLNSIFHTPKRYHYSLYFITLFNEPYEIYNNTRDSEGNVFSHWIVIIIDITEYKECKCFSIYNVIAICNIFNIKYIRESVTCICNRNAKCDNGRVQIKFYIKIKNDVRMYVDVYNISVNNL